MVAEVRKADFFLTVGLKGSGERGQLSPSTAGCLGKEGEGRRNWFMCKASECGGLREGEGQSVQVTQHKTWVRDAGQSRALAAMVTLVI